jgi:hypothetical protein
MCSKSVFQAVEHTLLYIFQIKLNSLFDYYFLNDIIIDNNNHIAFKHRMEMKTCWLIPSDIQSIK